MSQSDGNSSSTPISPFWPLCMLAVSIGVFLAWQVTVVVRQHMDLVEIKENQADQNKQAVQLENKARAMMADLVTLARTDAEARAIVETHKISVSAPPSDAGATQPQPRP